MTPPVTLPGFPDEAPPNLITSAAVIQGRATSASRGRPVGNYRIEPKVENVKSRRQSCSPSSTRGRQVVEPAGVVQKYLSKPKVGTSPGNGTLVAGSKMVEKMMNARRSVSRVDQKDGQAKDQNQANERASIGRLMSRTSLDMARRQMVRALDPESPGLCEQCLYCIFDLFVFFGLVFYRRSVRIKVV